MNVAFDLGVGRSEAPHLSGQQTDFEDRLASGCLGFARNAPIGKNN